MIRGSIVAGFYVCLFEISSWSHLNSTDHHQQARGQYGWPEVQKYGWSVPPLSRAQSRCWAKGSCRDFCTLEDCVLGEEKGEGGKAVYPLGTTG